MFFFALLVLRVVIRCRAATSLEGFILLLVVSMVTILLLGVCIQEGRGLGCFTTKRPWCSVIMCCKPREHTPENSRTATRRMQPRTRS